MERADKLRALWLIVLVMLTLAVRADGAFAAGRSAGQMSSAGGGVIVMGDHPPTIRPT